MRNYDCIVVFRPQLTESQLKEEINKVQSFITAHKGSEVSHDIWGKKQLAYPMKKQALGHYVTIKFKSESAEIVDELTSILRIAENILRFQVHRTGLKVRKFKGTVRKVDQMDWGIDDYMDDVAM